MKVWKLNNHILILYHRGIYEFYLGLDHVGVCWRRLAVGDSNLAVNGIIYFYCGDDGLRRHTHCTR